MFTFVLVAFFKKLTICCWSLKWLLQLSSCQMSTRSSTTITMTQQRHCWHSGTPAYQISMHCDDVMTRKRFPRHWPSVGRIHGWALQRASDVDLLCFLYRQIPPTVEQSVDLRVVWTPWGSGDVTIMAMWHCWQPRQHLHTQHLYTLVMLTCPPSWLACSNSALYCCYI